MSRRPQRTSAAYIHPDYQALYEALADGHMPDVTRLIDRISGKSELLAVAKAVYELDRDTGPVAGPVWRDLVARVAVNAREAIATATGKDGAA